MELRAWAEQIITATSLEDKLADPGHWTDERPGSAIVVPDQPGRPAELVFKRGETQDRGFPGIHRIENETDRGRLLHFFANHELLATELMALVLLRFPAAPAAFRAGVARTLRDEQQHTAWYMARMRELGIQFGDLPVSGYFWRSVSDMESPLDFVSRLSLTFEQANLDYCRQFSAMFADVGDSASASILERIYRDEIAHVAHGLKWFRRWKAAGESDWDAFCRQLKFPLSPARAKGVSFNADGRRAAGLTADFIDSLKVSAQSKGRTPTVWWFNPLAEGYIRQGSAFTPSQRQSILARDLANLPQFMARAGDIVLTSQRPSVAFLATLQDVGFDLPEWVEIEGHSGRMKPDLTGRKLGALRPWAWAPDSVDRLMPLASELSSQARALPESDGRWHCLYSKSWSADWFRRVWPMWQGTEGLCPLEVIGQAVRSASGAWAVIQQFRSLGYHRLVVKQSLGMAGDQTIRLWEPELLPNQVRWMERALESGRELVIEPWLDRLVDFSVQLEMTRDGLRTMGYTGLRCDLRGQYEGNWAGPDSNRRMPPQVRRLAPQHGPQGTPWDRLMVDLRDRLEPEFQALGYYGPVGVDAFAYKDSEGGIRLKPVVEINPRCTMGRLTLELHRYAAPGTTTGFRIYRLESVQKAGFANFTTFAESLGRELPVERTGLPHPQILRGAVCLNDPPTVAAYLAVAEFGARINGMVAPG